MARSSKELVVFALAAVLATTLLFRVSNYFIVYNVQVGDRAPGFDLTESVDGSGFGLDDYRGKWVLLNFWATWCPPCVEEMPSLNSLYESMRERGFVVLAVSIDEDLDQYRQFLNQANVTFPTVRDPERSVAARYGTFKYPESYLISPDGVVKRKYVGAENWRRPEIVNYLDSLL